MIEQPIQHCEACGTKIQFVRVDTLTEKTGWQVWYCPACQQEKSFFLKFQQLDMFKPQHSIPPEIPHP